VLVPGGDAQLAGIVSPAIAPLDAGPGADGQPQQLMFAAGYRYLGFPLTQTLDTQTYLKKRLQTLAAVHTRYFCFNSITRGFSFCLSLQLLNAWLG